MLHSNALFLNPNGGGEIPMPHPEGLRDSWEVSSLSVVRSWSPKPLSYGYGGVLSNGFAIALSLTPTRRRTIVNGRVVFDGWTAPGAMRLQRPGENVTTELMTSFDHIALYIPASIFNSVLRDQYQMDSEGVDIIDPLWRVDDVVHANLLCALSALEKKDTASFVYLNSMARALAAHVIYWHSTISGKPNAARRAEDNPMHRVVDFIDENIDQTLSLAQLAAVAGQSTDQFRREFKCFTELSPHQYLIKRRVARACELMSARSQPKLSQVALECGFADQSHLSTTFRRVLGVSPAGFRRRLPPLETAYARSKA